MPELTIAPDYVARLIAKVRGVQGREDFVDEDSGSNPVDDGMTDSLQDNPGDLSRQEIAKEIAGLSEDEQAELVALLWTGRGDAEPEDWEDTVALAIERRDSPTPSYLLRQPLLAEHWAEGLDRLGIETDSDLV